MVTITVNEKKHSFPQSITLFEVLTQLEISQNGIAIAINNNIIQKSKWPKTTLANTDALLIIKATQGG
ncbi:sulfur carrier protein ThiS [Bizionia gelidisalsuginis]|uniref:Sulfur carrier protein ThiS n=2 Tax=Bizionia TaxID=283785 RepID=A0A8H2LGZ1_9FLAO|nr:MULTISPECIES: sulfur carrier protein ThiS [Bizionia]TYB78012.1 sulfur carrier protein ThiS [Bizionia saleffrena]TYC12684.1 sulfur carrier protein ThiS [Bizionia gelidisalsuginis]